MNIIQAIASIFKPNQTQAIVETTGFILSKEEFLTVQELFKAKARVKQIDSQDILLYNIMRGRTLDHGFTPVTNPKKLAGGENAYLGHRRFTESRAMLQRSVEYFITGREPSYYVKCYNLTPKQCARIVEALK